MRLSEREKKVFFATELVPNRLARDVAKAVGCQEHSVRHAIGRLRSKGLFDPVPIVNMYMFGFMDFTYFLSLSSRRSNRERQKFLKRLEESPEVSWVGEMGGRYHYGISVLALHVSHATEVLGRAVAGFEDIVYTRQLSIRTASNMFNRSYLASGVQGSKPIRYRSHLVPWTLDDTEIKILNTMLTTDNKSLRDISRATGISSATVGRRLQKLESNGVIAGYRNYPSAERLGMEKYKIVLTLNGVKSSMYDLIYEFCNRHKNITHLIECSGSWDYEIGVEVEGGFDVPRITQEVYQTLGQCISCLEVIPEFRCLKFRSCPFPS